MELASLNEYIFTYGDTKAKPYVLDINKMEKYYTFIKYDDHLKLLPRKSYDKWHQKQSNHCNDKSDTEDKNSEKVKKLKCFF